MMSSRASMSNNKLIHDQWNVRCNHSSSDYGISLAYLRTVLPATLEIAGEQLLLHPYRALYEED